MLSVSLVPNALADQIAAKHVSSQRNSMVIY